MLDILQFYVSGFWVWLGITIGLYVCMALFVFIIHAFKALALAIKTKETT